MAADKKNSLLPATMNAPKYGNNYRDNAIISHKKESEAHQAMLNGKPLTNAHLVSQSGRDVSEKNSGQTIPNIHTGVKHTPMSKSALTGTADTTLQIQENSKYDKFDPNKPVPSQKGIREGFNLIDNSLDKSFKDVVKGELQINKGVIGSIAVLTGLVSFFPIIMKMSKTRDANNFTWLNLTLALISNSFFFAYGYLTKSNTNIASGTLYFLIYLFIVYIKFYN